MVDACQAYQCQNDANCVVEASEPKGRLCQCKDGYTGVNCQTSRLLIAESQSSFPFGCLSQIFVQLIKC